MANSSDNKRKKIRAPKGQFHPRISKPYGDDPYWWPVDYTEEVINEAKKEKAILEEELVKEQSRRNLWNGQTYFSEEEAADYLRISVKELLNLARIRHLDFAPIGKGGKRFRKADLDKVFEKRRRASIWGEE